MTNMSLYVVLAVKFIVFESNSATRAEKICSLSNLHGTIWADRFARLNNNPNDLVRLSSIIFFR